MEILDLIDKDRLQRIQDLFSDATGVALSIIDTKGKHVTRVSNFLDFCMNILVEVRLDWNVARNAI